MKRLLFLIAALCVCALPACAQSPFPSYYTGPQQFAGVPTGACTFQLAVNTLNGHLYDCLNGAWNDVGTTGGTVTNAAALGSGNVVTGAGGNAVQDSTIASANLVTAAANIASNALTKANGTKGVSASTVTDGGSGVQVGSPTGGAEGAGTLNVPTGYFLNGKPTLSVSAPTISSGFGTSPSITANNGPSAFRINVGTGGTANSGVIGLPTSATGWNCFAEDTSTISASVYRTRQTPASSTNSATIANYSNTGTNVAWTASDVINVSCFPF